MLQRPSDQADPPADLDSLPEEMSEVLHFIRQTALEQGHANCQLALLRLVEGVTLEDWNAFAARSDLENWLALPMEGSMADSLQGYQQTIERLVYQSEHDILTGLANRRCFDKHLHSELERAHRTRADMSLVLMDLDDFKRINDAYGHLAGDEVLRRLGKLLSSTVRIYDVAARIGGEEFCVILPGASTLRAQALAERVLSAFRQETFTAPGSNLRFRATLSAGIATAAAYAGYADSRTLLNEADNALYTAKRQGKDRVATTSTNASVVDNPALVRVAEKKFLFAGGGGS